MEFLGINAQRRYSLIIISVDMAASMHSTGLL